jgi:hypothetical protein
MVVLTLPTTIAGTVTVTATVGTSSSSRSVADVSPSPAPTADPVAGLTVTATATDGSVIGSATTAADGSFDLPLPAGDFVLTVQ